MMNRFDDEPLKGQELYNFWTQTLDDTFRFVKERYHDKWKKWLRLDCGKHWEDYRKEDEPYKNSANPAVEITCNLLGPLLLSLPWMNKHCSANA